jgi:signal transduction histidine kinase
MAFRRFRIQDKIVTPFVLLALVATVGAAWIALSLSSRALESRVESQLARGSALVSQSHFALNPSILELVKEIANADVVTYSADGTVLASTLDGERRQALARAVMGADATADALRGRDGATVVRQIVDEGITYSVAYRTVPARPGTVVAFVADTSELVSSTQQARTRILFAAGVTLLVLVIASQLIARRVSAPIEELVAFTREAGEGSPRRARVEGDDETARLAGAFNQMLDRLQTSQEALVRSEKLAVAGLLAARVAHDVRNPLSSIKMQTQLLRSRLRTDANSQAVLASVLRDIEQVESVVRGLLELARPGTLRLKRTQVNEIVEDVLRQLSPQMAHRKITLHTELQPDLPEILLDGERFRQALLNVVNNAADAMPDGGTLAIATSTAANGSTVLLDVCDDGTGVDPAVADRVFDPFVSTKRDGVGLGLVNTKSVVESHGGTVALEPRTPSGTRARIALPAVSNGAAAAAGVEDGGHPGRR